MTLTKPRKKNRTQAAAESFHPPDSLKNDQSENVPTLPMKGRIMFGFHSMRKSPAPSRPTTLARSPGNLILAFLPPDERDSLRDKLQTVQLEQGHVLYEAHMPVDRVYFLDEGMISVVSIMHNGDTIEVGTIGYEGMAGLSVALGVETIPYRHTVQVAGKAQQMRAADLTAELKANRMLPRLLNRYHAAFNTQVMQGMACNGLHSVVQRCCRWLLTTQDRVGSQELNITHEFLAQMLGVRRASITEVLRPLQADGLIRATRGKVIILDPKRLADTSCECYGIIRSEYQRLLR
jgi:CRP-like cAMP-binding protein